MKKIQLNRQVALLIVILGCWCVQNCSGSSSSSSFLRRVLKNENENEGICSDNDEVVVIDYELSLELYHLSAPQGMTCSHSELKTIGRLLSEAMDDPEIQEDFNIASFQSRLCIDDPSSNPSRRLQRQAQQQEQQRKLSQLFVYFYVFAGGGRCKLCLPDNNDIRRQRDRRQRQRQRQRRRLMKEEEVNGQGGRIKGRRTRVLKSKSKSKTKNETPVPSVQLPEPPSFSPTGAPSPLPFTVVEKYYDPEEEDDEEGKKKKKEAVDEFQAEIPELEIAVSQNLLDALLIEFGSTPGSCLYSLQASEIVVQVHLDLTTQTYQSTEEYCQGQNQYR